jgi:hypothetical protein
MSRKILGVPALYLVGLFVAILAVVAWRMKAAPTTEGDAENTDGSTIEPPNVDAVLDGDYSGLATNGTVTVTQPGANAETVIVDVETNDKWIAKGVNYLVSQGVTSAGKAQIALSAYVNGDALTYDQGRLRDAVIKQYGVPPETVTPGRTGSPTAKRNGNPPTTHVVVGGNDDTYRELAQLYYGRTDNPTIDLLQVANTSLGHAGPYAKGTRVMIPAYRVPKYFTSTKTTDTATEISAKNGISPVQLAELNDGMKFPVKPGTRVRVA